MFSASQEDTIRASEPKVGSHIISERCDVSIGRFFAGRKRTEISLIEKGQSFSSSAEHPSLSGPQAERRSAIATKAWEGGMLNVVW